MAKKSKGRSQEARAAVAYATKPTASQAAGRPLPLILGALCLAVGVAGSLALTVEHLSGLSLPGCGAESACAQVTNSVWGKVPGINWPVSYIGVAYFLAALVAWLATQADLPALLRLIARLGMLGSLGFCAIILVKRTYCPYCLAVHAGNFAFWITMELTRPRTPRLGPALGSAAGVFVLATAVLAGLDWQHREAVRVKSEQELADSTKNIIEASRSQPQPATQPAATQPAKPVETASKPVTTQPSPPPPTTRPAPTTTSAPAVFTGRYRYGPDVAAIRIVMFTGYQCPDCYDIEQQLLKILAQRKDVSVCIKHFPFNQECNPTLPKTTQLNGCWAARAAEAAGIMWGSDGFWKMHHWLFARHGVFETQQELENGIRELGYDPTGFVQVMMSDETQQRVLADVNEALSLGLHYTPMIFINGVELKGWNVPDALIRTVDTVAGTNPRPATAANDHPPTALEKYLADWRDQGIIAIPPVTRSYSLGPEDAPVKVVVFGDYLETGTEAADNVIRAYAANHNDVQYTFRSYPFNHSCNPEIPDQRHPMACRAAQAAEAAGIIGGRDAFWKMHTWLMENPNQVADQGLLTGATALGLDPAKLLATMPQDEVAAVIAEDVAAGKQLGVRSIPWIMINGKWVPRWSLNGESILDRMFAEAAKAAKAPQPSPGN